MVCKISHDIQKYRDNQTSREFFMVPFSLLCIAVHCSIHLSHIDFSTIKHVMYWQLIIFFFFTFCLQWLWKGWQLEQILFIWRNLGMLWRGCLSKWTIYCKFLNSFPFQPLRNTCNIWLWSWKQYCAIENSSYSFQMKAAAYSKYTPYNEINQIKPHCSVQWDEWTFRLFHPQCTSRSRSYCDISEGKTTPGSYFKPACMFSHWSR